MKLIIFNICIAVGWLMVLAGGVIINVGWGIAVAGVLMLLLVLSGAYFGGIYSPSAEKKPRQGEVA